jgi:hypothetical protein
VIQSSCRSRFGAKALKKPLVLGQCLVQQLYGNSTLELQVNGKEDARRRASTHGGHQAVSSAEHTPGLIGDARGRHSFILQPLPLQVVFKVNLRVMSDTETPPVPRIRPGPKDWVRKIFISFLIVGALVGIFFTGKNATTGMDNTSQNLPNSVERLLPASGDEVLRQAQVGLDLADGYKATLTINGTEIRSAEDGLITDLGTGQVLYQPGPDKPVESLNSGQNCVIAMVWDELELESTAVPVSWCFDAT